MRYEVRLLDRFELIQGGKTVQVRGALRRAVACVAIFGGSRQRSLVASTLWPEHPEHRALANLRSLVWRASVEQPGLLVADGTAIRLGDEVRVDYLDALAQVALDESVPLGTVLPGSDEEWLRLPRSMFQQYQVQRAEQTARGLIAEGRHPEAQRLLTAVINRHEARNSAHQLLAASLEASGQFSAADEVYERIQYHLSLRGLASTSRSRPARSSSPDSDPEVPIPHRPKERAA